MNPLLLGAIGGVVLLLALLAFWLWRRRRRRSSVSDAIRAIALERLENVLVPDGMGGEIHIENLVLTAGGILVLDVRRYEGTIFASDLMDPWTVIGPKGRATFANPLGNLYDRIAAVRQLSRDIDVAGFVVFPGGADFSKGRPASVLSPDDLLAAYSRPEPEEAGRIAEAFAPHWETLRSASQPARL